MDSCRKFHEREFPGSKCVRQRRVFDSGLPSLNLPACRLSTAVCGPVILPCASNSFADDAEGFYRLCLDQVLALAKAGPFPEVVSASAAEDHVRAADVIVFTVFADWGQEAAEGNLHKYYITKPAAKAQVNISDITRVSGCAWLARLSLVFQRIMTTCRLVALGLRSTAECRCLTFPL